MLEWISKHSKLPYKRQHDLLREKLRTVIQMAETIRAKRLLSPDDAFILFPELTGNPLLLQM